MDENIKETNVMTDTNSTVKEDTKPKDDVQNISAEDQLQNMRIEMAKIKKAFDKTASELASTKKQLREKQSADEIALQEKAEREAEKEAQFQQLLKENTVTKYEKSFLKLGYPEELAQRASNAQYDGDTDELFRIQSEYQAMRDKKLEEEWMKSRPQANVGVDSDKEVDSFLQGFGL